MILGNSAESIALKKKAKKLPRIGSFAFVFSIPALFLLSVHCFFTLCFLIPIYGFEREVWASLLLGAIGAGGVVAASEIQRLRTFFHELKHAVVVVLTGNKLSKFKVEKHEGHVHYEMCRTKLHLEPFIALAPYCLPLFSFPVLFVALFLDESFRPPLCFLLGTALSVDLTTGYQEWHPYQTDLKRFFGGLLSAAFFVICFQVFWTLFCLIWVVGSTKGYLLMFELSVRVGQKLL